jgi:hypothetical protein
MDIGLKVRPNPEKVKYMFKFPEHSTRSNVKTDNKPFEYLIKLKHLGTTLKNENKLKSRLISGQF